MLSPGGVGEADQDDDPVRVVVTREDLEEGIRGDSRCCALARAIKRRLELDVEVTGAYLEIAGLPRYTCSGGLADWLFAFDGGCVAEPMTIELGTAVAAIVR